MNKYDLSILIPARNEMFVAKTVESLLANIRGNTEIIIALDGAFADPGIPSNDRVTILYFPQSIGQRAATNQAARLSQAKYVMKIDAHCTVDEGFDVKMMEEMKDDYTMIPKLYNLHAFDWVCADGHRRYQSPSGPCKEKDCGKPTTRDIIWKPRFNRESTFYRFDTTLHFQYHGVRKHDPRATGDIVETFSAQGSCFMLTREKYWELNICDEKHGSWGQQGTEIALKTWLSGGKLVTNKKTWYSHMFRTQGGDFGFPYPLSGKQVDHARKYSQDLWLNNKWDKQIHPLSWLIEKFKPLPDWHDESGKRVLEMVNKKGESFYMDHETFNHGKPTQITKGIIYYTDNKLKLKYAHKVQGQLKKTGLPIISASLKPMPHFGENVYIKLERGLTAYFTQIISALEKSTADIVYMCEHDVLYHPSHFDFVPERKDIFYYNQNFWRIRPEVDNFAVHWDANQVSGLVAYREMVLRWYKEKWYQIQLTGFDRSYEPGGRNGKQIVVWKSQYPNVDIRHAGTLTKSKWSLNDFRDKSTSKGWTESTLEQIPGWDKKFLQSLR